MKPAYTANIGLEVHAELHTKSKMFCSCPVVDLVDTPPNTVVCPICAGMPGTLPMVNTQAVSMALRNYPNIGKDTIEQVRRVARQVGYRPNLIARNLRRKKTKAVGFVFPDITFDYSQKLSLIHI